MEKHAQVRFSKIIAKPNRSFKVVPYSVEWPKQFENKAHVLRQILGPEILTIEHIGSTAVPGMMAKPQIDIVVTVKDLSKIPKYYELMQKAGFTPRGNYTGEGVEYFSEDSKDGVRKVSVHVLPHGHVMIDDFINVRDYLRTHPDEVARYSAAKRQAREQHGNNYDAYYKGKLTVIQDLRQKAADWKRDKKLNKSTRES